MPELPEVETIRRGLLPIVQGQTIHRVDIHQPRLRYLVPANFEKTAQNTIITDIQRQAKYLLFALDNNHTLIAHLGMSGTFLTCSTKTPLKKHDHVVFTFGNNLQLRYHDPRRFGALDFTSTSDLSQHRFFKNTGPEPLGEGFNGSYLQDKLKKTHKSIKQAIMDASIVAGVGNIYASESLFHAGILPTRAADSLTQKEYRVLVQAIRAILREAIKAGGSSLKDFRHSDGKPGYFQHNFKVYGHKNKPCQTCSTPIRQIVLGQRSTFYCTQCQK